MNVLAEIRKYYSKKVLPGDSLYENTNDPHDPINLSFYLEKRFKIDFGDDWSTAHQIDTVGESVTVTEEKQGLACTYYITNNLKAKTVKKEAKTER